MLLRLCAIALAMFTDSIDGYLARKYQSTSRLGAILDPAMDKFFVYFGMTVFYFEGRISPLEMSFMLSRDLSLALYGLLMLFYGKIHEIRFQAIRWGKISTSLQFLVLIALTLHFTVNGWIYGMFLIMGILAFIELLRLNTPWRNHPQRG